MAFSDQMRVVYQLGTQRLHLWRTAIEDEPPTAIRGNSTNLTGSPYRLWSDARFLVDEPQVEFSGQVFGTFRQTSSAQIAALRRLSGYPIDVIAYTVESVPVWLHTFGYITSVEPRKPDLLEPTSVSVAVDLQSFWEPLNMLVWKFTDLSIDPFQRRDTPIRFVASQTPGLGRTINPRFEESERWVRLNFKTNNWLYDPASWEVSHPQGSDSKSWSEGGWFTIDTDADVWNAPPRSLYAFRNLPTTGAITIKVVRERGWGTEEDIVTMDLAQLDSDIGVLKKDIVILGDVNRLPGIVLRNGELLDFSPRVTYSGKFWPGYMLPGQNRLYIDPAGGQCAHQIVFRRL